MRFHARIGVLPHEAEIAQSVEVDLVLWVTRAHGEIGPHNILDYRHAYDTVSEVVTEGHIRYLEEAAERIAEKALALPLVRRARAALPQTRCIGETPVEETAPLGDADQNPYLNQMIAIETGLSPHRLLAELRAVEAAAGRIRGAKWA